MHLRVQLIEYDPGLAAMCREVFGDTELTYTKPATRLTGHLEGYDPSQAPTFQWPARLVHAHQEISRQARERDELANGQGTRIVRDVAGWSVSIDKTLLQKHRARTERALELLDTQLQEIVRVVPRSAVAELQKVRLYFSPPYEGFGETAEYHPDIEWLTKHGRDPEMAKGIEFTNIRIFRMEVERMPNFALHELSHAYHDRVLPQGYANPEIQAAFDRAKKSGSYDKVERHFGNGKPNTVEKAYAMTDPMEYFAESSEAFFARNDFFPFTRDELRQHDPDMFALLERMWNVQDAGSPKK